MQFLQCREVGPNTSRKVTLRLRLHSDFTRRFLQKCMDPLNHMEGRTDPLPGRGKGIKADQIDRDWAELQNAQECLFQH